jgi:hypothetical protein
MVLSTTIPVRRDDPTAICGMIQELVVEGAEVQASTASYPFKHSPAQSAARHAASLRYNRVGLIRPLRRKAKLYYNSCREYQSGTELW